ncbi:Cro/Cl family transcriptional regulator [Pseudomonas sp. ERGC3:05]|nr:Cro/Cl family transcriptional regulator [Pseudomonas sp. ERGC3:05]
MLGCTQGALSKAIRVGRDVVVTCNEDGSHSALEQRPFPSQTSAA